MPASLRTVALVLIAAFTTACSHATPSNAVPLVRESRVPLRPPTVALVVGSHASQRGVQYTTDWSTARVVTMQAPRAPVPWPSEERVAISQPVTIAFDTRVEPDFVTVSAFTRVVTGTGIPATAPVATYECGRFTEPHCDVAATGSGLSIRGIQPTLLSAGYLTVFCTWHVPQAEQRAVPNALDDVTGSWLFHVDARDAP